MRKNVGVKPYLLPMPVLIIGTYSENEIPNAMNAAYGSLRDFSSVSIYISKSHKTTKNILNTKAFTVNFANLDYLLDADYVGIVSGNEDSNKLENTAFECEKSDYVNAPVITSLPMALECELIDYDEEDGRLTGKILNVSVDESYFIDDKINIDDMNLITYNPIDNTYNLIGDYVGDAFTAKDIIEDDEYVEEDLELKKKRLEKDLQDRIERIEYMNKIMNELSTAQEKLNSALDEFEKIMAKSEEFEKYYSSSDWLDDYYAYELGFVPKDMVRAVINEDIPYDVLGENFNLTKRMKEILNKLLGRY